ncbi:MAG: hypothetical protein HXN36_03925 [Prevotella histicola]|uniref:hypothetical protein n=1 Tax=Prevotella histicola TaxID=470565 RepID=UPI001CB3A598|nr:hypothetical protein [Prevotella histicola]MBF1394085.1 hypothetical protein [Prevotella histicola]MBS6661592.1 hypothetical protein [Prevotella histicola]
MMEVLLVDNYPLMDNSPFEGDQEDSNKGTGPEPLDAKPVPLFELDTNNLWDKWEE